MAKPKTTPKRPASLDQFAADLSVTATGPRTVTFRLHGREQTLTTAELRKSMRAIRPAIDWILAHVEAVCAEADAKGGRPRVPKR